MDLALRATKQAAAAMGRAMERHLWLNLEDIGRKEENTNSS